MATNDPIVNAALDAVAKKMGLSREEALKVVVAKGLEGAGTGAKAYTQGNQISFAKDDFSPQSQSGKRLLAHELNHVIQQRAAAIKQP
jgi:Domain of unknown function (DUF4157)